MNSIFCVIIFLFNNNLPKHSIILSLFIYIYIYFYVYLFLCIFFNFFCYLSVVFFFCVLEKKNFLWYFVLKVIFGLKMASVGVNKKNKPPRVDIDEDKDDDDNNDDDRVMKDVIAPPRFPLAHNKLFKKDGSIDLEALGEHLNREGRLRLEDAFHLVKTCSDLYKRESNLLTLKDPITGYIYL